MSRFRAALSAVVIAGLPYAASAQSYADPADSACLVERIDRMEHDLSQLQGQVYRGSDSNGDGTQPPAARGAVSGNLEVRLSQIEEQMRTLTGKVEKAEFTAGKVNERVDKMAADNEFRFGELEKKAGNGGAIAQPGLSSNSNAVGKAGTGAAAGTATPVNPAASTADSDGYVEDNATHTLGAMPADQLSGTATKTAVDTSPIDTGDGLSEDDDTGKGKQAQAQAQYDQAITLLHQSKTADAEKSFRKFIQANPANPLIGSAYYWLGEIYASQKIYDSAAKQFLKGYKAAPKGAKAPNNLLKLSLSLDKLKKKREACAVLTKLSSEFPSASGDVTQKATDESARLGCK